MGSHCALFSCRYLSAGVFRNLRPAAFRRDLHDHYDGSVVNGNGVYATACDVYLDGGAGPGASNKARGLPDGDYYFQVTDPDGHNLLSIDPPVCRQISVENGIVTGTGNSDPACAHMLGYDQDLYARSVQLCPFNQRTDGGDVYKVWITPVGDGSLQGGGFVDDPNEVDNACGPGCFFGFLPNRSKTDNFKVDNFGSTTETFCLTVHKKVVVGTPSGPAIIDGEGWEINVQDPFTNTTSSYLTDANGNVDICGLVQDTFYQVYETQQIGYKIRSVNVNGDLDDDDPSILVTIQAFPDAPTTPQTIVYTNEPKGIVQ